MHLLIVEELSKWIGWRVIRSVNVHSRTTTSNRDVVDLGLFRREWKSKLAGTDCISAGCYCYLCWRRLIASFFVVVASYIAQTVRSAVRVCGIAEINYDLFRGGSTTTSARDLWAFIAEHPPDRKICMCIYVSFHSFRFFSPFFLSFARRALSSRAFFPAVAAFALSTTADCRTSGIRDPATCAVRQTKPGRNRFDTNAEF